ncbi:GNAT family N-acetyltransferase [Neobacillus sp. CF12]|uniref:GNAT family N-acetyltransferase n=1 Tax=Neobacillus sp. CF12 TaxID=3055864 RepID=UPI0025A0E835|nr:GNAT family N-acetyltransferase [Neobacillus sp. CF12]MDM5327142.1 GNAT family N-acetyltransferase [Neobacillus sp. CF12]
MEIIELRDRNDLFEEAIKVFWDVWGNEDNYKFYEDCMIHSITSKDLPRFFVALENSEIIGTYALLRNDLNSRQDLCPWLACLFVDREYRGKKIGSMLLDHGLKEAEKKGYKKLYLTSDLENFYEKYGWKNNGVAYGVSGGHIKVYVKEI